MSHRGVFVCFQLEISMKVYASIFRKFFGEYAWFLQPKSVMTSSGGLFFRKEMPEDTGFVRDQALFVMFAYHFFSMRVRFRLF